MANLQNRGFLVKTTVGTESSRDSLLLEDKNFNYSITRYPQDLGTASFGRGHYIIFHVLQQRQSQYKTPNNPTGGEATSNYALDARLRGPSAFQNAGELLEEFYKFSSPTQTTNTTNSERSDIPILGPVLNGLGVANGLIKEGFGPNGQLRELGKNIAKPEFVRTIEKSSQAIALYMPDSLNFVQGQGYDDISPGNTFMTALFAGGKSVYDSIAAYNKEGSKMSPNTLGKNLATNMSPFVASFLGNFLDKMGGQGAGRLLAAAGTGMVTNPMIEVIYSSPSLRQFRFDFMFYPQSYQEGLAVQKIIQSFQFHQAPEIAPNNTSGYFLVPPSEFDIEFYYNGKENVNIPSISTCVLTSMDVDYAPNGFTAYEVPGQDLTYGGTGMPVAIKMSLDFKETSIVFKSSRQFTSLETGK
jgi:hypothetical protein